LGGGADRVLPRRFGEGLVEPLAVLDWIGLKSGSIAAWSIVAFAYTSAKVFFGRLGTAAEGDLEAAGVGELAEPLGREESAESLIRPRSVPFCIAVSARRKAAANFSGGLARLCSSC